MRKLASIRKISAIKPIQDAEFIELAMVDGWQLVIKKGEFKVGELCIYCEIDSFLPIDEKYEFLRKSSYKKMGDLEGFRLKTIKLRGEISQGLLLPLSLLAQDIDFVEGQDVSEFLGIIKYEPPIPASLAGIAKGIFPGFIPKTDEERIQNLTNLYEEYKKHTFYVTEKLDGSSTTFYWNDGEFGVCSRNLELLETEDNTFWKVANELKLKEKLKNLQKNLALQAELIGEGIQGNPYRIKGQTVKFFNIYQISEKRYLNIEEFQHYLQLLDLESVPILDVEFKLPEHIEDLLNFADGFSSLYQVHREGLVIRSLDRKISFKVISNQFLCIFNK